MTTYRNFVFVIVGFLLERYNYIQRFIRMEIEIDSIAYRLLSLPESEKNQLRREYTLDHVTEL